MPRVVIGATALICLSTASVAAVAAPAIPPDIGLTVTAEGPFYPFMDLDYVIEVTNPSDAQYSSVEVRGVGDSDAPGGPTPNETTGPIEQVGNGDDFLDPGERWRYSGRGLLVVGAREFVVAATAPGGTTVTNSTIFVVPETVQPLDITMTPDQSPAIFGSDVTWTITAALTAPYSLRGVQAGAQERSERTAELGPELDLGNALVHGGDGNDTIDPDELWTWQVTLPAANGSTRLIASIRHVRADDGFEATFFTSNAESDIVSVIIVDPPPPTTLPTTLPETGYEQMLLWPAALLFALGSLMLIAVRRPRRPITH